jgi:hypothetical protein
MAYGLELLNFLWVTCGETPNSFAVRTHIFFLILLSYQQHAAVNSHILLSVCQSLPETV